MCIVVGGRSCQDWPLQKRLQVAAWSLWLSVLFFLFLAMVIDSISAVDETIGGTAYEAHFGWKKVRLIKGNIFSFDDLEYCDDDQTKKYPIASQSNFDDMCSSGGAYMAFALLAFFTGTITLSLDFIAPMVTNYKPPQLCIFISWCIEFFFIFLVMVIAASTFQKAAKIEYTAVDALGNTSQVSIEVSSGSSTGLMIWDFILSIGALCVSTYYFYVLRTEADSNSGQTYQPNAVQQQTVVVHRQPNQIQNAPPAPRPPTNTGLPPHWRSATTEDGKVYYMNDLDQTTQWERPTQ